MYSGAVADDYSEIRYGDDIKDDYGQTFKPKTWCFFIFMTYRYMAYIPTLQNIVAKTV